MFQPTLETKKKFIAWFIKNHQLKRREALWILNYLLNHELLLKQIHFVFNVEETPRGMKLASVQASEVSFVYIKNGHVFDNPEQAFHDIRLNWKEDCYIELCFPDAYAIMISFGVVEDNPYHKEEESLTNQMEVEIELLQKEALMAELKEQISLSLENDDKESFYKFSTQLKELKEGI